MMRPLAETRSRWEETLKCCSDFSSLQRAIRFNGSESPCLSGCRSVCWKRFLLFQDSPQSNWSHILLEARNSYGLVRDQCLKYIKHPEKLAELSLDPLADVPDSPWDAVRRDELLRAEILQDVQRLPDDPFYHEERIQMIILDILFIYCKLNPTSGSYRQGMHELLAPLVYVVHQDAIDRDAVASDGEVDSAMLEMLDSCFIEHDAFSLFARIMEHASTFYEVGRGSGGRSSDQSAIVERSQHIHEVILMKLDPGLSNHLKAIEVLPQIFLIRWVRLLFGREFPFEQVLVLWDALFAFDPSLDLVDLICAAMLIRIRWTLLEADYSVALQLLLKYPSPPEPHGPPTFVDDALYLKDHLNVAGGSALILKYTGKAPATSLTNSRPSTPTFQGFTLRNRTLGARSPLSASARLLQHPGGVEALFQGAAKGVIERGERLGINQAVRDAMGEIRRNMQGLGDARSPGRLARGSPADDGLGSLSAAVAVLERRNRQLAAMLDESVATLKAVVASKLEGDRDKYVETIDTVATKIESVKLRLEDTSLALPGEELPAISTLSISPRAERRRSPTVALDTTPVVMTSSAVESVRSTLASPSPTRHGYDGAEERQHKASPLPLPTPPGQRATMPGKSPTDEPDRMDMDTDVPEDARPDTNNTAPATANPAPEPHPAEPKVRPAVPLPSRSTLAQSSFSWMLEPDETAIISSSSSRSPPPSSSRASTARKNIIRPGRTNVSRERNAFLFGEVDPGDVDEAGAAGGMVPGVVAAGGSGGNGERGDGGGLFGMETLSRKE